MNPARIKRSTYRPARVTAAVLVHLPNFAGYHEHRLPVVRACLETLSAHTDVPHDLLVFDNASVPEVGATLDALEASGRLQFRIRSKVNVGKLSALRMIFDAAPGELVAYCDDDFYFYPGWLERQLALYDAFPNVGMVSGYAVPGFFVEERIDATLAFARQTPGAVLREDERVPQDWIEDWARSTGRGPEDLAAEAAKAPAYVVEYGGREAFAAAHHDQFLAPRAVIRECFPEGWSDRLMGGMLELDAAVNAAGHLRLTTHERTTQHLGNVLTPDMAARLPGLDGAAQAAQAPSPPGVWMRFLRWAPVRAVLLSLYSRLFHIIHPD